MLQWQTKTTQVLVDIAKGIFWGSISRYFITWTIDTQLVFSFTLASLSMWKEGGVLFCSIVYCNIQIVVANIS
jgi:hypothetical protein